MNKYWKLFASKIDARSMQERILLLAALLVVMFYAYFVFVIEPLQIQAKDFKSRIGSVNAEIIAEANRQSEINATYSDNPNSYVSDRRSELVEANADADRQLQQLYGQLVDPGEMSYTLTRLLPSDSDLQIVSMSKQPIELLTSAANGNTANNTTGVQGTIEVYRQGLQMVLEGSYLETVKFLYGLEALDTKFFWEKLEYTVTAEYPKARISLDIYTLSTEQGLTGG